MRIVDARVLDERQLQDERRVAEERRLKQEEQRALNEAARQKSAKASAEWQARQHAALERDLAEFRVGLKQGHLIRWLIRAPEDFAVGMVVRIEGDLVFVQFSNAVVGGSNTPTYGEVNSFRGTACLQARRTTCLEAGASHVRAREWHRSAAALRLRPGRRVLSQRHWSAASR